MTNKKIKPESGLVPHIIKTVILVLLYGAAAYFFINSCKQIADNFLLLFLFKAESVPYLIQLGIFILLFALAAGLVAVLVRPIWLLYPVAVLPAIILPVVFGFSGMIGIFAAVTALFLVIYVSGVENKLKNQIKFSLNPLAEANRTLYFIIPLLISMALALGYAADMAKRDYIILPEYRQMSIDYSSKQISATIEKDETIPAEMRGIAIKKAQESMEKMWTDLDRTFKPYTEYVPAYIGLLVFSLVKLAASLLGAIPLLLISGIIALLKKIKVINLKTETMEVSRLEI